MPFLTEAIWAATPHAAGDPELLMVADWPGPEVSARRDPAAESDVSVAIELVRGVRNARSEARLAPAAWLPIEVTADGPLAAAIESLRPAVERLARVRPLSIRTIGRGAGSGAPAGGLTVVGTGFSAVVGRPGADAGTEAGAEGAADLERVRLERELAAARALLAASQARLANPEFTAKAPLPVVEGARARDRELAEQVRRLEERLRS
jgi:valyl-tRNA synthetase